MSEPPSAQDARSGVVGPDKGNGLPIHVAIGSRIGVELADVEVRYGDGTWEAVGPMASGKGELVIERDRWPSEMRARAHVPTQIKAGQIACLLEPMHSFSLVVAPRDAGSHWLRSARVFTPLSSIDSVKSAIDAVVSDSPTMSGYAIAVDVVRLREIIGSERKMSISVVFSSGYIASASWMPEPGVQIVEHIDPAYSSAAPTGSLRVTVADATGSQIEYANGDFTFGLAAIYDPYGGVVLARPWGQIAIHWSGGEPMLATGFRGAEFEGLQMGSEYCVVAESSDGATFGIEHFTFDGTEVHVPVVVRNRVKGLVRSVAQERATPQEIFVKVRYEDAPNPHELEVETKAVLEPDGAFECNAVASPGCRGSSFPPPRFARIEIRAPGFREWEAAVTWSPQVAAASLGVVELEPETDALVLKPIPDHLDESWHAVAIRGRTTDAQVRMASVDRDLVFIALEQLSEADSAPLGDHILITRDRVGSIMSGFSRSDAKWLETGQARYEVQVVSTVPPAKGERLEFGIEWRGVTRSFGSFSIDDFDNETTSELVAITAPASNLLFWMRLIDDKYTPLGERTVVPVRPGRTIVSAP